MRQKLTYTILLLFVTVGNAIAGVSDPYWSDWFKTRHHPKHVMKVWTTTFVYNHKHIYRVIMLPRCEHIEVIPTFLPIGETKEHAKKRLKGIAVCTSGYYNPANYRAVDYFRRDGVIIVGREVGRSFLAIYPDGRLDISRDYSWLKSNIDINAVALGPNLNPFQYQGFKLNFSTRMTDRMAIGLTDNNVFIVQGCSDLKALSEFMKYVLHCQKAINTDGGHVVKGLSPYHLVFRWKTK